MLCGPYCSICSSSSTCSICNLGFIVDGSGSCVCGPGTYFSSTNSICETCSTALTGCLDCQSSALCMACDTVNGYLLVGSSCVLCSSINQFCLNCDPTGCITCQVGYVLLLGVCTDCATALSNPGCLECSLTTCTLCSTTYVLNSATSLCIIPAPTPQIPPTCNTNEILFLGSCQLCSALYNSLCAQCDATSCLLCISGYIYNLVSAQCEIQSTSKT